MLLNPLWLAFPRRQILARKNTPGVHQRALVFSFPLISPCPPWFKTFSVFRQADGLAEAMRGALHSLYQQTKLPDTIYGAYALKPYNI